MAAWKLILVAHKARQGWRRIPPAQRRAIVRTAQEAALKHGPVVARRVRQEGPDVARRVVAGARRPRPGP